MKYIIDLDGTLLSGDTANLDAVAFMNHLNATNTDVKGAISVGCSSALIKSGKYTEGDESLVPETLCLDCLMDIINEENSEVIK